MSPAGNQVRAVVVDDDRFAHVQLEAHLRRHRGSVELIARCGDGEEGVRAIQAMKPDLVFLDVQMPGMDGFGLLDKLEHRNFGVIFITGFERYAIRAIRYSALDFLLKPYTAQDFDAAIARFIAQRELMPARMEFLLGNKTGPEAPPSTLLIPTRSGDRRVRTQDIVRCESDRNYTWFHLRSKEKLLSSYTLGSYEEFLAESEFIRVHRSHIVNIKHVRACDVEGLLTMNDGTVIEVSRRRRTEVVGALRGR